MSKRRTSTILLVLILLLFFSIFINARKGSVELGSRDIFEYILNKKSLTDFESTVLYKIRLPRIISAIIFGGALSISGFLLQTFFKNPIVGPFVLGISSGAKLFVGFFILTSTAFPFVGLGPFRIFLVSFMGSILSMLFVLYFARRTDNVTGLVIIGIMIGYIASAATNFLITFASEYKIASLHSWSQGSFSVITWEMIRVSVYIIFPTIFFTYLLSKPLEAYLLGENYAKSMGINIRNFRMVIIFLSSVLSACVTAFAGPISFVGIAVPHLARLGIKTSNPRILIPAIFLLGASFTLIADYFARTIFAPTELSISTVTSFIGAPLVIWLMADRRRRA